MTVCQGCGRACNSDLCCPTCASLSRNSFFCSQECFAGNWKEHSKLHAIIKQQLKLSELDSKERKIRGLNAASSAFSAISEIFRAPSPDKLHVSELDKNQSRASTAATTPSTTFKDHELRPVDRLLGPNGVLRGFRVFLLLSGIVLLTFLKINSLISEIPVVVETRAAKVSETMNVQSAAVGNSAVLVSARKESDESANAIPSSPPSNEDLLLIKNLRGEIAGLKAELDMYKAAATQTAAAEVTTNPPFVVLDHLGEVQPELVESESPNVNDSTKSEPAHEPTQMIDPAVNLPPEVVGMVHAPERLLLQRHPVGLVRSA